SEDGTYVMTAQVKGGEEGTQYHYAWSTGTDTQSISGIASGKLIGTTVTITADQKFGSLKAQLEVPKAPQITVQSGPTGLEVRWTVPENTDNRPMPDCYIVLLYQGKTLLKTLTPEAAATSATFDALSEQTEYTITINAISPVGQSDRLTLSAATTKASSGGSSGGGGSSGDSSGSGSPAVNTVTSGNTTTSTATVTPTVSGTTANVTVSSATVTSAVNSALAAAQKNSTAPAVKVAVNTPPKADSLSVTIPADALETLAGHKDAALTITSGVAQVTLDRNALMAVARQAGTDVTISVKPVTISDLNTDQQKATGGSKVFDISIASGSAAEIHDLGGGAASVSIPYTLKDGETAATLTVYYLADNGSLTACETSYDGTSGMVTFVTPHFSKYMVGYRTAAAFTDVASTTYYYDAVQWAVEQGITAGNSATTFAPGQSCTRAQIVTFLWRASGSPVPTTTQNPFTDVNEDACYYHAVLWAVEKGITSGFSATTFAPNAVSNRAQVVTFLWRAEGSPAASGAGFSDVSADAYYAQAVTWAMNQGIASGRSNGQFVPGDLCTRAQAVTFLYRTMGD
ncbi:S-layer homology domain-containing protein, partial [Oscillibacter sp.]|uniref:S-layer homology domain-containing protein n=1 Tax=Oscillibacter sp. TaxID=1945593 RepID=UPI00289C5157